MPAKRKSNSVTLTLAKKTRRSRKNAIVKRSRGRLAAIPLYRRPTTKWENLHRQTFEYTVIRPLNSPSFFLKGDRASSTSLFPFLARLNGEGNSGSTDPRSVTYQATGRNGFYGLPETALEYDEYNPVNLSVYSKVITYTPTESDHEGFGRVQPTAYPASSTLKAVNGQQTLTPIALPGPNNNAPGSYSVDTFVYSDFNGISDLVDTPATANSFRNARRKEFKLGSSYTKILSITPRQLGTQWTQNTNAFLPVGTMFTPLSTPQNPSTRAFSGSTTQPRFGGAYYVHHSITAASAGYNGEGTTGTLPVLYVQDRVTMTMAFRGKRNLLNNFSGKL